MSIDAAGIIMAAVFALSGCICVLASVLDWDWFFRSQGVRMLTYRLSRRWQRALYGVLGVLMFGMSWCVIKALFVG